MRWIFLCLIFFNLLYFGWEFYYLPSQPVRDEVTLPVASQAVEGKRLVLLKEVLGTASQSAPPPSIEWGARRNQVKSFGAEESMDSEPQEPAQEDEDLSPSLMVNDDISESDQQGAEPALTRVCAKVGPYADEAQARALLVNLQERGVQPVIRQDDVVLDEDSWVIIPPLDSRSEALRVLRRLQNNKIDSYLIAEGEFTNGISLGLFKQTSSAQGVLAKMASAGYAAEIHQIKRTQPRFWVGLSGEFEPGSIDQMLTQLVDDSEKINFSETLCEMFASTP